MPGMRHGLSLASLAAMLLACATPQPSGEPFSAAAFCRDMSQALITGDERAAERITRDLMTTGLERDQVMDQMRRTTKTIAGATQLLTHGTPARFVGQVPSVSARGGYTSIEHWQGGNGAHLYLGCNVRLAPDGTHARSRFDFSTDPNSVRQNQRQFIGETRAAPPETEI